jgi:hypothetical protein
MCSLWSGYPLADGAISWKRQQLNIWRSSISSVKLSCDMMYMHYTLFSHLYVIPFVYFINHTGKKEHTWKELHPRYAEMDDLPSHLKSCQKILWNTSLSFCMVSALSSFLCIFQGFLCYDDICCSFMFGEHLHVFLHTGVVKWGTPDDCPAV